MNLLGRILFYLFLGSLSAGALAAQADSTSVGERTTTPMWTLAVDTTVIARLWTYDTTCAKVAPLPGHDWRNVTWRAGALREADGNLGEWFRGDTIAIDTSIINSATPAFRHRIFAHELQHQNLQGRNVIDSTSDPRVRETGDSIHPLAVFVVRCDFPGGYEGPTFDVLGEQDDVGASRGHVRPVPIFIPMPMQRPQQ